MFGDKTKSNVYSIARLSATRTITYIEKQLGDYLRAYAEAKKLLINSPEWIQDEIQTDLTQFMNSVPLNKDGVPPIINVTATQLTWKEIYPKFVTRNIARLIYLFNKYISKSILPICDTKLKARYMILPYAVTVYTDWLWEQLILDWYIESGDDAPGLTREDILADEKLCDNAQIYYNKYNPEFGWYMKWRSSNPPVTNIVSNLLVPGVKVRAEIIVSATQLCPEPVSVVCTVQ